MFSYRVCSFNLTRMVNYPLQQKSERNNKQLTNIKTTALELAASETFGSKSNFKF